MGVLGAIIGAVATIGGASIAAHGAEKTAAANAAAQSELNEATMAFNREEAAKARDWSAEQSDIERQYNAEQAEISRQFTERLTSSAHQREMLDLKAAGLNPILAANSGASVGPAAVASASHPSASQASVSGLNAPTKANSLGAFVSTAMEGLRLANDVKRAEAADLKAHADYQNSITNAKRQAQDALESMERITNIKSDSKLKNWQILSEEKQVALFKEKITSEIRERTDKHNLSVAQQKAVLISAEAAATAANAQSHMAALQDRIQSAESPARIEKLKREADYWQSQFDKNKWIMSDPEVIMQREWWKHNEGAVGLKETAEIIGKFFRGGLFLPIKN